MNPVENCSKEFDSSFDKIKKISWLPWVGQRYNLTKILILGESQYEDGDEWQEGNKNATRTLIGQRFSGSKGVICTNTEKVLLSKTHPTQEEGNYIWHSVTYWNLVQRLMTSRNDRPTDLDFDYGWRTFFNVIDIVKPEICIVLGKSSCGRLGYYLNNNETDWKRTISEFYEKEKVINLTKNEFKIKLIFINHPSGSRGFDYKKWATLINENEPGLKDILSVEKNQTALKD